MTDRKPPAISKFMPILAAFGLLDGVEVQVNRRVLHAGYNRRVRSGRKPSGKTKVYYVRHSAAVEAVTVRVKDEYKTALRAVTPRRPSAEVAAQGWRDAQAAKVSADRRGRRDKKRKGKQAAA